MGLLVAERFGRRISYLAMQFVVLVGIAVSYSATSYGGALAGRILVQCFVGWDNFLVPMFLAEISPAGLRGAIVVIYVFAHIFGSLICSFITLVTAKYEGDASWKIPLASMFAFPAFVLLFSWFIPESPRWLVRKGQNESALKHLRWLRGSRFSEEDSQVEVHALQESIERDREIKGKWGDFLKGPNRVSLCYFRAVWSKSNNYLNLETTPDRNRCRYLQSNYRTKFHEPIWGYIHQKPRYIEPLYIPVNRVGNHLSGPHHHLHIR